MIRRIRRLAAAFAVAGLLMGAPGVASAGELSKTTLDSEAASPMVDVLLMRPLGLIGLGAAALLWVPAQTLTMAVRWNDREDWRKPYDALIREPYEFVFVDPLGTH